MSLFRIGALVLYHSKCATITAVTPEKIEIRIEGGAVKSVRPKDIEFLHPGPVTVLPPAILPAPNAEELLALMENETLPFEEFAQIAYNSDSVEAFYSACKLLQDGVFFTGTIAHGVRAKSRDEIDAALNALNEKAAKQLRHAELLERIRSCALLPGDLTNMREIEQVALGETESSRLLKELNIEATPNKAHALLLKLGVWDAFVNPWPSRVGVDTAGPTLELASLPQEERVDLTHLVALAIDDEGSNDPDDAISYSDGLLYVHVADPAALVTPESPADNEAMNRGENLYLPEKVTHMLPAAATELFGLGLHKESPALTFAIRISDSGEATLEKMCLSTVRVERLTYSQAGDRINETPIKELQILLDRFKAKRRGAGALFIDLPEVKIKVSNREVLITPIGITPERELVANAMLAAGSAVAKYATENEIVLPFATQAPPDLAKYPIDTQSGIAAMFALRKSCPPSTINTVPSPHAGLGLECYVRVTSPLRRYGDLLAHQQLRRVIKGEEPLTMEYLDSRIATAEREALTRRRLERQTNEFWTLVYLSQHPDFQADAVMVLRQDDRLTYLIPELAFEFKNRFGGKIELGEQVRVQLAFADPAEGIANFRIL
ncbi:MAG: RNB domain-containing ribonuclease [Victivallales bacterium]|jgi:exoribonuclease-2|nr:RNB domain-containing ribonuclease [Victivallales bacterium]